MSSLCCCEYIDETGRRNHILACCCDCQNLDESFESLINGQSVTPKNRSGMASTFNDRLRIPWLGGAKRVDRDVVLPIFYQFALIALATFNVTCTWIAGILLIIVLLSFYRKETQYPSFFLTWAITTTAILYFVFEFYVVSLLEISLEENIVLGIFTVIFILFAHIARKQLPADAPLSEDGYYCSICRIQNNLRYGHHCRWLNICITQGNQYYYCLSLICAVLALAFSANLTLTTICRPFVFYKTILMPDDCSDAYQVLDFSLSFALACYSTLLSLILLLNLSCWVFMFSSRFGCVRNVKLKLKSACCLIRRTKSIDSISQF